LTIPSATIVPDLPANAGRAHRAPAGEAWQALQRLQDWVEAHNYRGYEPFDGLLSWARPLAFGNIFAQRLLMQAIRQCPWNLRPLMGVRPQDSTKGRGYMAAGYLILYGETQNEDFLAKAIQCLEWLDKHKVARFRNHSWSNHFDFVSRGGSYTKDDPIIVWTSLIGHAYMDAFEVTGNSWFLEIANSACRWILDLPREKTSRGTSLSYLAHVQASVHNANMLGAGLLARTAKHDGNEEYVRVARSAMEYSCSRQQADGSWRYGEEDKYYWVDNFHTGYNLDSLDTYIESTGDTEYRPNLERGLTYYTANFFEESGRPKYYNTRGYPIDIQCVAQSIETLSRFSDRDATSAKRAKKVVSWAIRNMQDRDGHFYYRQYPLITAKTPMLHWGQATMFKALAAFCASVRDENPFGPAWRANRSGPSQR
jgi:rhamnogalacturonyl hydrolase YesR